MKQRLPDTRSAKEEYVRSLFDGVAAHYDFLNHLLSSGIDIWWRKRAIRLLRPQRPQTILDVATGTADVAIEAARTLRVKVTGVDLSQAMLDLGREKVRRKGLDQHVTLRRGAVESLPEPDGTYDAVTVAFGVRNFSDVHKGLSEMARVLKPGGTAVVLEFSKPKTFPFRQLYGVYFRSILPLVAGIVSNQRESYEYLPQSVLAFPDGPEFLAMMRAAGFADTRQIRLTFGIASIYLGTKPAPDSNHIDLQ